MKRENSLSYGVRKSLLSHKHKLTFYIVSILWIAVVMQVVVSKLVQSETDILAALIRTNSEDSTYELETAAHFGNGDLSLEAKEEIIYYVADKIGLTINDEINVKKLDKDSEVFIEKESKNAKTLIKLVSVEEKDSLGISETNHYILIRLRIGEDSKSILSYRNLIKDILTDLGTSNIQTTIQLIDTYEGKLSLDEINSIADNMIDSLYGKVSYENRQEDFFTVYAYSALLEEYITSMDTKINIHIAANFDEQSNTTKLYLGSPVIKIDY